MISESIRRRNNAFSYFFIFWRCTTISAKELQINDEIKAREVRLIANDGEQLGIVPLDQAKNIAYNKDLDLVLIAPTAEPPADMPVLSLNTR